MNQLYATIEVTAFKSRYGGICHKIILVGVTDRQLYTTYIDKRNANAGNWQHIINHPDNGFILGRLRKKRNKEDIISADSDPIIRYETENPQEIADELEMAWKRRDELRMGPDLFA